MSAPDGGEAEREEREQALIDAEFAALVARFTDDEGPEETPRQVTSTIPPPRRTGPASRTHPANEGDRGTRSGHESEGAPDPNVGFAASIPRWSDDAHPTPAAAWRQYTPPEDDDLEDEGPEIPELPPFRPSSIALLGCALVLLSAILACCLILGMRLPWFAGWLSLGCLLGGVAALLSRLPQTRDPSDGDGARL